MKQSIWEKPKVDVSAEYEKLVDRICRLYDENAELYWDWQKYSREQSYRLPPGPGSAIKRVQNEVMKEWMTENNVDF